MSRRFWRFIAKYAADRADMRLLERGQSEGTEIGVTIPAIRIEPWPLHPTTTTSAPEIGNIIWTYT